jgi:hypothetical protein
MLSFKSVLGNQESLEFSFTCKISTYVETRMDDHCREGSTFLSESHSSEYTFLTRLMIFIYTKNGFRYQSSAGISRFGIIFQVEKQILTR